MDAKTLRDLVRDRIEPEEPSAVVAALCQEHAGKPLTKRFADQAGQLLDEPGVQLRRQYGMTHLENDRRGWSFLLAYTEKNAEVPTVEKLRELSPAYYSGQEARNAKRRAMLADDGGRFAEAAKALDAYKAALERAKDAAEALEPDEIAAVEAAGIKYPIGGEY